MAIIRLFGGAIIRIIRGSSNLLEPNQANRPACAGASDEPAGRPTRSLSEVFHAAQRDVEPFVCSLTNDSTVWRVGFIASFARTTEGEGGSVQHPQLRAFGADVGGQQTSWEVVDWQLLLA